MRDEAGRDRQARAARRGFLRVMLAAGWIAAVAPSVPPAAAHGYGKDDLQVRHPWTRATPPGAKVGAAYLEIRNSGREPDRLVGATTPVAERVEVHVAEREGDIMKMREVTAFEVPGRERRGLRPGGPHLMMIGLKQPLVKGERVPLTLRFERAGEVQIEVEVQAGDSRKPHH